MKPSGKNLFLVLLLPLLLWSGEVSLDDFFMQNGSVMLLIDPDNGRILRANRAASTFYGYPVQTLESMGIQQINTFSKEQVAAERKKAAAENRNFFIFRHRLANGDVRRVEVYSHPILYHGKKTLFSIIHDVSNVELAQQTIGHYSKTLEEQVDIRTLQLLREEKTVRYLAVFALLISFIVIAVLAYIIRQHGKSAQTLRQYKEILDNVGAAIYMKDPEGRYTYANRRVCEIFNLPPEEIRAGPRILDSMLR